MKTKYVSFLRLAPQIGCHIAMSLQWTVAIWMWMHCHKAHWSLCTCWKLGENHSIDSGGNNANVRIFACVHPPTFSKRATTSQWFAAPTFTKCLQDVEATAPESLYGYRFAIFPTVVKCHHTNEGVSCQLVAVSRHKIGCYGNVPWLSSPNFSHKNSFIDGINAIQTLCLCRNTFVRSSSHVHRRNTLWGFSVPMAWVTMDSIPFSGRQCRIKVGAVDAAALGPFKK